MIRRACYVACDVVGCGDPAEVTTTGAKDARDIAWAAGWKQIRRQDVCPRHIDRGPNGSWGLKLEARLER